MIRRVLVIAGLLTVTPQVTYAFWGECLLEVGGRSYMNGPCEIVLQAGGSFSIGTGERRRSKYIAYVEIQRDASTRTARGFWNGKDGEGHAHEELGVLAPQGACWANSQAKVCAWKLGTRPREAGAEERPAMPAPAQPTTQLRTQRLACRDRDDHDVLRYFIRRNDPNGEKDFMVEMVKQGRCLFVPPGTPISLEAFDTDPRNSCVRIQGEPRCGGDGKAGAMPLRSSRDANQFGSL